MKLSLESIEKGEWKGADVQVPEWDIHKMRNRTIRMPLWLHFGAGNIFRALIARQQQSLLDMGRCDRGIVVAEAFDPEIIDEVYTPYDNLSIAVYMHSDGTLDKHLIASIAESIKAGDNSIRIKDIFRERSLEIVSFTITEKGYALKDMDDNWLPSVAEDMRNGPRNPHGIIAIVASSLYERFRAGTFPLALVSMDNCSRNGEKLRNAVLIMIETWLNIGLVPRAFLDYVMDEANVSFPWSMIDKITPQPSDYVQDVLTDMGIENMRSIRTSKNTFIAPFVNSEAPEYLVIEDTFPNGRPPLELSGTIFTDRHNVEQAEKMKVTTCLNPLHTALALFGCLLGYTSIAEEMKNPNLRMLIERIGYDEGLIVVPQCTIIDPNQFIREVIELRLPNPFIPDTPQRIAIDTSQKIAVRFGETIKSYIQQPDLNPQSLTFIPIVIAAWFRYLLGFNDALEPMQISPDPLALGIARSLAGVSPEDPSSYSGELIPLLKNETLFGSNLIQAGLASKIEDSFTAMLNGAGSIETHLSETLAGIGKN